jgi:hypothetical protein
MKTLSRYLHAKIVTNVRSEEGMEMVQIAIIVGIALVAGVLFRTQIKDFITGVFSGLNGAHFNSSAG